MNSSTITGKITGDSFILFKFLSSFFFKISFFVLGITKLTINNKHTIYTYMDILYICMHACQIISVMSNSATLSTVALPGSSVHEILQARILECVVIPFSRGSS